MCKVLWKRLFSKLSASQKCTMFQMKNFINRSSVPFDPQRNVKASEDFLLLLLQVHVVSAAKELLQYDVDMSISQVARSIVNTHLLLPCDEPEEIEAELDGVTLYARELITLSLVWHYFHDASKEADGDRILLSWKIMLPIFKATKHYNYAKEAVLLLIQSQKLSDRMRAQLLWSRCINTKGRKGCNIPCDLHMEHLNRRLKTVLRSMGANMKSASILRASRSLYAVQNSCLQFEEETCSSVSTQSAHADRHKKLAYGKDFSSLLDLLIKEKVFQPQEGRHHQSFAFTKGLMQYYNVEQLINNLKKNLQEL